MLMVDCDVPNLRKLRAPFKQCFNFYVQVKSLGSAPEAQKIGILMTSVGGKGVEVFYTLSLTDESKYVEVIAAFHQYCQPKKNTVFEWYLFNKIVQSEGRTFDSFLIQLKMQATFCEFGKEKDVIRDRIVLGVNDPTLMELMLRDSALTLKKAEDLCRIYEASKHQTDDIHGSGMPGPSLVVDELSQGWRNNDNPGAAVLKKMREHMATVMLVIPGKVKIYHDSSVTPVIEPQWRVPLKLKHKLKDTLQDLEKRGIIMEGKAPHRLGLKFSSSRKTKSKTEAMYTSNIIEQRFSISMLEDITTELASTTVFTVLDVKQAYCHMKLDEQSSLFTTFHTPFGRFRCNRLCFGISCAPEIFIK
ncbi:hypothetical protein PR048_012219 [Dryococelus australis]|uniref:Reverse transcriptase domain-containing protein n=1 Tax=Dryococelus australis TaxID=614101 RepID=A0ABQ9HQ12_9NEOP|nr:hypothetical protein PR048_012219 [Dryococelus australis]